MGNLQNKPELLIQTPLSYLRSNTQVSLYRNVFYQCICLYSSKIIKYLAIDVSLYITLYRKLIDTWVYYILWKHDLLLNPMREGTARTNIGTTTTDLFPTMSWKINNRNTWYSRCQTLNFGISIIIWNYLKSPVSVQLNLFKNWEFELSNSFNETQVSHRTCYIFHIFSLFHFQCLVNIALYFCC